jgi:hypothetical protein
MLLGLKNSIKIRRNFQGDSKIPGPKQQLKIHPKTSPKKNLHTTFKHLMLSHNREKHEKNEPFLFHEILRSSNSEKDHLKIVIISNFEARNKKRFLW